MAREQRKLVAIPTGDVVGYSGLKLNVLWAAPGLPADARHLCASPFSIAAFFCIDPLDEPTQYATTLDAIPASAPSSSVTMSRWLA